MHILHAFVGIFLTLALAGCIGSRPQASLTVGAEGFEPPVATVDAGKSFDLEIVNDTQAVQTVTSPAGRPCACRPGRRAPARSTRSPAGDHKVTLEGAPFEATLRAEE